MKERPIIFGGPMMLAILSGSKTQTRRPIKLQPNHEGWSIVRIEQIGKNWNITTCIDDFHGELKCPYGQPGDELWVREIWQAAKGYDTLKPSKISSRSGIKYLADGLCSWTDDDAGDVVWGRTRRSIYMPRWASRIQLEITDIRVERIQDISEEDAKAEGAEHWNPLVKTVRNFENLWNSINEKRGFGWEKNPHCWVIEFKKKETNNE